MSLPPLCAVCGDYHHDWQAHVFRKFSNVGSSLAKPFPAPNSDSGVSTETRTSDRKKSFAKKDGAKAIDTLSRACLECERLVRENDRLRAEIEALRNQQVVTPAVVMNVVTPTVTEASNRSNAQKSNVSNEKSNKDFDKKTYQREYMRKRRAKSSA